MKNKYFKRICSCILILAMVFELIPNTVMAEETKASLSKEEVVVNSKDLESLTDEEQEPQEPVTVIGELEDKREEKVKHFLMSDRSIQAVLYSDPVHYYEDGKWEDVDSSLIFEDAQDEEDFSGYTNKKGDFSAKVSKKGNSVRIKKGKYQLNFELAKENENSKQKIHEAKIKKKDKTPSVGNENTYDEAFQVDTVSDSIVYEGITDNEDTDIEYNITSSGLKENIIVHNKQDAYQYIFDINVKNLILELKDNKITAIDPATHEAIYMIPAPFMYDANHEMSTNVTYALKETKKGYQLDISADKEWINHKDRVFPVTIDPVINTETTKGAITSTFISSKMSTTNFNDYQMLLVGVETSSYDRCRTLLKFELPELNTGDIIESAYLNLLQYNLSAYSVGNPDMPINAYRITGDWDASTVTWSTIPSVNNNVMDYTYIKAAEENKIVDKAFDITKAVKEWYDGTAANYGIMIRSNVETGDYSKVAMNARFWSEKYNAVTDAYPMIVLRYRNTKGIEDYYSYTQLSAGNAGTAAIHNYTGNLVFAQEGVQTNGLKMPVSVYLVYNSNCADTKQFSTKPISGYGWKLNVQQYIKDSKGYGLTGQAHEMYPYVYIDGDGTEHYFMKIDDGTTTTYIDEDGLGLVLSRDSQSGIYTIKDNNDNVMTFTSYGNLQSIQDANGNTITIKYTSGILTSVVDGAGKTIKITNTDSYLTGMIDPAGRTTNFTVQGDLLTKVTNPDGTSNIYSYDADRALTSAKDSSGSELRFAYLSKAKGKRVSASTEYATKDGVLSKGQTVGFNYSGYNTTKIKTSGLDNIYNTEDDITTTLQFDNYGRLISTQSNSNGKQLGTSLAEYTSGQANGTASNIKQLNRVTRNYGMGSNVNNLLLNHNVETLDKWTLLKTGTSIETVGNSTKYSYIGEKSLKIGVSSATSTSNVRYRQILTSDVLVPGKTYTFSGYIKTEGISTVIPNTNGAFLMASSSFSDGSYQSFYSDYISSTTDTQINDGWRRESVTFTVPKDAIQTSVNLVLKAANGNAYFDALQLEEGNTANSYNLLENGSFEHASPLYGYTATDLNPETDGPTLDTYWDGKTGCYILGEKAKLKRISQEVAVSGSKNDTYIISGWAKACSVPAYVQDGCSSVDRRFKISIKLTFTDGSYVWKSPAEFNQNIVGWQYAASVINLSDNTSSNKIPKSLTIYPSYDNQANNVVFDNLSIIKDEVPRYTYDSNGNLISMEDNAKQNSTMKYKNNDLISSTDPKGYENTYTYDTKHNMTQSKSQRGITHNYTYNTSGNPTKLIIQNAESASSVMKIQTDNTYTEDGDYVSTISDQDGYVTTYNYDTNKGLLDSVTDAKGNTISYTYDSQNDYPTKEASTVSEQEIANNYEYSNQALSKIAHNGFDFNFYYDAFGNISSVNVGNVALTSYAYNSNNGDLSKVTYGNGDYKTYTYDEYGNVTKVAVNGNPRYQWYTDNSGSITKHEDLLNNLLCNYDYDITGRLIRKNVMDTSKPANTERNAYILEYGYDVNNNVTKFVNKAGSRTLTNLYDFTKDNLLNTYTLPTGKTVSYSYDSLNRMNQYEIGTTSPIKANYTYAVSMRNAEGESTYQTSKIYEETVGSNGIRYSYDELGNVSAIYEKNAEGDYVLTNSYEYDELSQLIRENDAKQNISKVYTYDLGGNIISIKEYAFTTEELGEELSTITYEYGDTNWKDKLTSYNGQAINYDEIGNPISYKGHTLVWNNGRELTSLIGNGIDASYTYDSDGLRVSKTVNGITTAYQYEDGKLLYEKKGNIELHYSYDANGEIKGIQMVDDNGVVTNYYIVSNIRGDVTQIYNEEGLLEAIYTYDTWGKILSIKDANGNEIVSDTHIGKLNSLRYRGYYYDIETELYYLKSRYYNPETLRFLNADGQINDGLVGANLFAYCNNNPVNRIDEDGCVSVSCSKISSSEVKVTIKVTDGDIRKLKASIQASVIIFDAACFALGQLGGIPSLGISELAAGIVATAVSAIYGLCLVYIDYKDYGNGATITFNMKHGIKTKKYPVFAKNPRIGMTYIHHWKSYKLPYAYLSSVPRLTWKK